VPPPAWAPQRAAAWVLRIARRGAEAAAATEKPAARDSSRAMRVSTLATGLESPWEIAFLPSGRALVTERPGRVRLLERNGKIPPAPVAQIPVIAKREGGLLGLAIDPRFAANRFV
jgi:aldose sugar dehydrogenase